MWGRGRATLSSAIYRAALSVELTTERRRQYLDAALIPHFFLKIYKVSINLSIKCERQHIQLWGWAGLVDGYGKTNTREQHSEK